jgi:hypothetical protein
VAKDSRRKFKRYRCAVCGEYFGLESALKRVRRDFQLPDGLIGLCPKCRRERAAEGLAASIRELPSLEDNGKG